MYKNVAVGLALFLVMILFLFSQTKLVENSSDNQAGGYYYGSAFSPVRGAYSTVSVPDGIEVPGKLDIEGATHDLKGGAAVKVLYSGFDGPGHFDGWTPEAAQINSGGSFGSGHGWKPNTFIGTSSYGFGPYRLPYLRDRLNYWWRIYRRPLWSYTPYRRAFYTLGW